MSLLIRFSPVMLALFVCGCQTSNTSLLSWSRDAEVPSLTQAELNATMDGPDVDGEVFAETSTKPVQDDGSARQQRVDQWLQRGRQSIASADSSPRKSRMLADATQAFREVLKIDSENAAAFHGLAIVSDLNQDWDLAEMNYKHALSQSRDDVNLLNDLGYSYLLQERFAEAAQYLNRAVQIDNRHEKARINLAILNIKRGDQSSARLHLAQIYPTHQVETTLESILQAHRPQVDDALVSDRVRPRYEAGGTTQAVAPVQTAAHRQSVVTDAGPRPQTAPVFGPGGIIHPPGPQQNSSNGTSAQPDVQMTPPVVRSRSVGRTVTLPPQIQMRPPQLPPSANVFTPRAGTMPVLPSAGPPVSQGPLAVNPGVISPTGMPPAYGADSGVPQRMVPAAPMPQTPPNWHGHGISPAPHGIPPAGAYGPAGNGNLAAPVGAALLPTPPGVPSGLIPGSPLHDDGLHGQPPVSVYPDGTVFAGPSTPAVNQRGTPASPVGFASPVQQQATRMGSPGTPPTASVSATPPTSRQQPGPGYFAPGPVFGQGYQPQNPPTMDPLQQYRAARQQTEYQRALQAAGHPQPGSLQ